MASSIVLAAKHVVDGECVVVGSTTADVKVCGYGKLTLSRMTDQVTGYKATVKEHTKADFTTQCENMSVAGTNHVV